LPEKRVGEEGKWVKMTPPTQAHKQEKNPIGKKYLWPFVIGGSFTYFKTRPRHTMLLVAIVMCVVARYVHKSRREPKNHSSSRYSMEKKKENENKRGGRREFQGSDVRNVYKRNR
jgi:hypothetical protein